MAQINWEQTDGRVVKVESIFAGGRRQLIVTFSYEAQGDRYEGELYTFKSINVGESVVVKYDARDPNMTEFKAAYARKWLIWWIVMAGFLVVALSIMLWIRMLRS